MEERLGHDFGTVRVHADARAAESAAAVGSLAYTVGNHVVLGSAATSGDQGRRVLAHELVHTIQQAGTSHHARGSELPVSRPADPEEQTADRIADAVLDGSAPATIDATAGRALQRADSPPLADTEDCTPGETALLNTHLVAARIWVNDATRKIVDYANVFANPRHSTVPASPGTAAVVKQALLDNFHTVASGDVLEIRDGFQSLRTELSNGFTYECEDEGCDDQAYVRGRFAFIRRRGDIHVCPPWFRENYYNRVETLIHERAHQYPGAEDEAYNWQPSYATLSPSDAIDNADSYAVAARQIYHGGAHGPGT